MCGQGVAGGSPSPASVEPGRLPDLGPSQGGSLSQGRTRQPGSALCPFSSSQVRRLDIWAPCGWVLCSGPGNQAEMKASARLHSLCKGLGRLQAPSDRWPCSSSCSCRTEVRFLAGCHQGHSWL